MDDLRKHVLDDAVELMETLGIVTPLVTTANNSAPAQLEPVDRELAHSGDIGGLVEGANESTRLNKIAAQRTGGRYFSAPCRLRPGHLHKEFGALPCLKAAGGGDSMKADELKKYGLALYSRLGKAVYLRRANGTQST